MKKLFLPLALTAIVTLSGCSSSEQKTEKAAEQMQDSSVTPVPEDSAAKKKREILDFKFFYTIANLP